MSTMAYPDNVPAAVLAQIEQCTSCEPERRPRMFICDYHDGYWSGCDAAYERSILVETLVYHWRTSTAGCGCGWAELGRSHADHVADVYEASMAARA